MKPLGSHKTFHHLEGHQHCGICRPTKTGGRAFAKRTDKSLIAEQIEITNHPDDLGRLNFPLKDILTEEYPVPWEYIDRGNGHTDIIDVKGRVFASVYCFKDSDFEVVLEWIERHNAQG